MGDRRSDRQGDERERGSTRNGKEDWPIQRTVPLRTTRPGRAPVS